MDAILYTLDFSDKFILPATSKEVGYVSMNAKIEFCDSGSCEMVFCCKQLENFMRAHPEGLFIIWGNFQGYITDWQFKKDGKRLFGSHLNSIIHKAVFPPQNLSKDDRVEVVMEKLVGEHIPWLNFVKTKETYGAVEFSNDVYTYADNFVKEYFTVAKLGYKIYIQNKKLYFEILKPTSNSLMLSENNLNIYEIQEDFSNKSTAFGGWYKKREEDDGTKLEDEQWLYIESAESREGIYKQDAILSASSPQKAKEELEALVDEYAVALKSRNIRYGDDYCIGDIVRLQQEKSTIRKQITAIELWLEGSTYHEEPQLADYKEE